jgi:hypothetical protein
MTYPPVFNLRTVSRAGGSERQLTFGDASYVQPDIVAAGKLFAGRVRMQSDIWRFPVAGKPADNVKNGARITQQTGQVQTPSASPDGKEVVYLSDSGGHVNVWVAKVDGSSTRQITFERDPAMVIGIPVWSPAGDRIAMIQSREGTNSEWLINPDGSGLRELVPRGAGAAWSGDGWLYTPQRQPAAVRSLRSDAGAPPSVCSAKLRTWRSLPRFGDLLLPDVSSPATFERRSRKRTSANVCPPSPICTFRSYSGYVLSPDNRWLTMPLTDAGTTNIWAFPAGGGPPSTHRFGRSASSPARCIGRRTQSIYASSRPSCCLRNAP